MLYDFRDKFHAVPIPELSTFCPIPAAACLMETGNSNSYFRFNTTKLYLVMAVKVTIPQMQQQLSLQAYQ